MSLKPNSPPAGNVTAEQKSPYHSGIAKLLPAARAFMFVSVLGLIMRIVMIAILGSLAVETFQDDLNVPLDEPHPAQVFINIAFVLGGFLIFDIISVYGAMKMKAGRSLEMVYIAAAIQILCGGCGIFSMGVAIWSLIVVNQPDVKACFWR